MEAHAPRPGVAGLPAVVDPRVHEAEVDERGGFAVHHPLAAGQPLDLRQDDGLADIGAELRTDRRSAALERTEQTPKPHGQEGYTWFQLRHPRGGTSASPLSSAATSGNCRANRASRASTLMLQLKRLETPSFRPSATALASTRDRRGELE